MAKAKKKIDPIVKLNMGFEEAMKKALSTPLPTEKKKKTKKKGYK
ncbi:MAG: hypothetical protein U0U70_07910 [Chitinophagaceae bacterium]